MAPGETDVPYIFRFNDEDKVMEVTCPFLVMEVPKDFSGPGTSAWREKLMPTVGCVRLFASDSSGILEA